METTFGLDGNFMFFYANNLGIFHMNGIRVSNTYAY